MGNLGPMPMTHKLPVNRCRWDQGAVLSHSTTRNPNQTTVLPAGRQAALHSTLDVQTTKFDQRGMNCKQRLVERGQFRLLVGRLRSETCHGKILMAVDSGEASRRSRASLNARSDGEECPTASTATTTKTRGRKKTVNSPTGGMVLRGKENSAQALGSPPRRKTKSSTERVEVCISSHENPTVVLDEDSNEVYPVGQFFGNLDHLPDYPERPSTTEPTGRREHRRRHYYAKEDSEEDEPH